MFTRPLKVTDNSVDNDVQYIQNNEHSTTEERCARATMWSKSEIIHQNKVESRNRSVDF